MHAKKPRPAFQAVTLLAGVVMLLIIFVSVGYFFTLPDTEPSTSRSMIYHELDRNRSLWQKSRPDAYEYIVDRNCMLCAPEYREPFRVTHRQSVSEFRFDDDSSWSGSQNPPEPVDIPALFDRIELALRNERGVQAFYDADFGFPSIVRIAGESGSLDDEMAYDIREFRALP